MLKNINHDAEETRTAAQQLQKRAPLPQEEPRGKLANKENSDNPQLKPPSHAPRRKAESNGLASRETFAVYSKVHSVCLEKFHTLFLAFHLYELAIANPLLKGVPHAYKSLCCMFLAIKYEEIYPTELSELAKCMKIFCNLNDYRRYERAILMSIGMDLDVVTLDRVLEDHFIQ